jgi:SAM-dependent methyltransferase
MNNQEFLYKDLDLEGLNTLETLAKAEKLNHWFYETIAPYCKGNVLEIGSGLGNISQFFIQNKTDITLSDLRNNYLEALTKRFPNFDQNKFITLDLVHPNFDSEYKHLFNHFDTIFALNVVEHILEDQQAINNCYKLLKKEGHLIVLVPAYQALYNRFDKELHHYKRYTQKSLNALFNIANLQIIHNQYFNFTGIFGWIFSGKILNKKLIPEGQVSFYNKLVPLFKIIDKCIFNTIGLSVITIGKK